AGGGALLRGIDKVLHQSTGLDVRIADDPLTCVARGTANYLENLDLFKDTLESDADSV
ncbi:MAG: rod shape-determining protein, partial [Planctomycetota bacterium]